MYTNNNGLGSFTDIFSQVLQAAPRIISTVRSPSVPVYSPVYSSVQTPTTFPQGPAPVAAPSSSGLADNPVLVLGLGALALLLIGGAKRRRK